MTQACVRCGAPAGIVMRFDYGDAVVWLDDLTDAVAAGDGYPMCQSHAARFTPPVRWTLVDRRQDERPLFASLEVA